MLCEILIQSPSMAKLMTKAALKRALAEIHPEPGKHARVLCHRHLSAITMLTKPIGAQFHGEFAQLPSWPLPCWLREPHRLGLKNALIVVVATVKGGGAPAGAVVTNQ